MSRSTTHPAEWVILGMALACLLWVAAAAYVGKQRAVPECSVTLPTTTIKSQEFST